MISIHAPARSDSETREERVRRKIFQSTLPRGERHLQIVKADVLVFKFQSTLPRGERPDHIKRRRQTNQISIHAPARGATAFLCQVGASVWLFQSTLPRGERPTYFVSYVLDLYISIHAPARGATIFLFWTWTR